MTRPTGTLLIDGQFQYVTGPASPGTLILGGRFHILDPRPVDTITLGGTYAFGKPDPEVFEYTGTDWSAQASYIWDGSKWLG
jgi:hypothetical protein